MKGSLSGTKNAKQTKLIDYKLIRSNSGRAAPILAFPYQTLLYAKPIRNTGTDSR